MHMFAKQPARAAVLAIVVATGLAACGGDSPPSRSSSARMSTVPDLISREQGAAHRMAARAGFTLRWMGFAGKAAHGRYDVPCTEVMSQSPVGGERRPRGAQIAVIEKACRLPRTGPHGIDW